MFLTRMDLPATTTTASPQKTAAKSVMYPLAPANVIRDTFFSPMALRAWWITATAIMVRLINSYSCMFTFYYSGGCNQTCTSPSGTCSCGASYVLNGNGKACDFNYCYNNISGCAQTCAVPSGNCSCGNGYKLNANGKGCDVNYCYTSNGGCEQTCTFPDTCSCNVDYVLNVDNKTCAYNNCYINNGLQMIFYRLCFLMLFYHRRLQYHVLKPKRDM